jgi:hypothetical protein
MLGIFRIPVGNAEDTLSIPQGMRICSFARSPPSLLEDLFTGEHEHPKHSSGNLINRRVTTHESRLRLDNEPARLGLARLVILTS